MLSQQSVIRRYPRFTLVHGRRCCARAISALLCRLYRIGQTRLIQVLYVLALTFDTLAAVRGVLV